MEEMSMPRTTTTDWFSIINKCRTSGLTDHQWCKENDVCYSTFYYHVKQLQKEACELPTSIKKCVIPMKQEVVPINFSEIEEPIYAAGVHTISEVAITLQLNNVTLHISNTANADVISNTIQALQRLY